MDILIGFLILFPLFMFTVVVHEVSHGVVANFLGDPTARQAGRLTLNPLKHIDPFGTLLFPLMLKLIHSPILFGWAKPVPVDFRNLPHPKRDMLWVGAAGPVSNFLVAVAASLVMRAGGLAWPPMMISILQALALMNLSLGLFNLLPIPPLDGSRILVGLLPMAWAAAVLKFEKWGILVLMALLYFGVGDRLIWPAVGWSAKFLGLL